MKLNTVRNRSLFKQNLDTINWQYNNHIITDKEYRIYKHIWLWSAYRFGWPYGNIQDRYVDKFGLNRLNRRIARFQKLIEKIIGN